METKGHIITDEQLADYNRLLELDKKSKRKLTFHVERVRYHSGHRITQDIFGSQELIDFNIETYEEDLIKSISKKVGEILYDERLNLDEEFSKINNKYIEIEDFKHKSSAIFELMSNCKTRRSFKKNYVKIKELIVETHE